MKDRRLTMVASLAIAVLAGVCGMQDSSAQAPAGFKRVELQRHDLGTPGHEAVTARGEFEPGAAVPRHTHPGEEIGYVLAGELMLEIEGKPPVTVKAGETFFVPAGMVHSGKNPGKAAATVISTYVVEKGKPLSTPAK